jgi:hypothetical protein
MVFYYNRIVEDDIHFYGSLGQFGFLLSNYV